LGFWFTFTRPNQVDLDAGRATAVWRDEVAPHLDSFVSKPAFERLCRAWLRANLGIHPGLPRRGEVGAWWGPSTRVTAAGPRTEQREAEIVVRSGQAVTLVGEAKWSDRPLGTDALAQLRTTVPAIPDTSAKTTLALFARDRFTDEVRAVAAAEGILLLTADDMIGA
jgi:hypothetical protein